MEEPPPWDPVPDESAPAHRAFIIYRDLGVDRTLGNVDQKLALDAPTGEQDGRKMGGKRAANGRSRGASSSVRRWAKQFRWDERARAYDHHLESARARGVAKAVESYAAKRQRQALESEDQTLAAANQLKIQAFQMLKADLYETTRESEELDKDCRVVRVVNRIEPVGWRKRDAAYMLKVARDLEDTVFHFGHREPKESIAAHGDATPRATTSEVQSEATRRVEAHRAAMRTKMHMMPTVPPGKPEGADDEDEAID